MTDIVEELRGPLPMVGGYHGDYVDEDAVLDTFKNAADEIERLREALHKLIQACDAGKLREVGIGGMTLDAQLRRSVLNGVSAWAVEEARAALGEEK